MYIFILFGFGIISYIVLIFLGKLVFGYLGMVYVMISIGVFGFFVWVYYMFIVGLDVDICVYFIVVIMIIVVFIGIKIFSWIVIMWGGLI